MATQQLVVRLPADLAHDLDRAAERSGRRRSAVVRDALHAYLRPAGRSPLRAADRVSHLIGSLESGVPDLARNHRRHVLESLTRGR
jgi:metal-responsive CopG/Arc/MetJ family transcriptional regulator